MRTLAILIGAILAIGVSAASKAQVPPSVWQGSVFVTSVTPTCTDTDVTAVGNFYTAVYRPNIPASPPNQANEALTLVTPRSAFLLAATDKTLRGKAKADGVEIGSRAIVSEMATTVVLKITPATITKSTPVVQISGTINNLFNETGCNVGVVGALGLRP
jgi:hypothetical protein